MLTYTCQGVTYMSKKFIWIGSEREQEKIILRIIDWAQKQRIPISNLNENNIFEALKDKPGDI